MTGSRKFNHAGFSKIIVTTINELPQKSLSQTGVIMRTGRPGDHGGSMSYGR